MIRLGAVLARSPVMSVANPDASRAWAPWPHSGASSATSMPMGGSSADDKALALHDSGCRPSLWALVGVALTFFLWVNACNFINHGPWFELAFFMVNTVPVVLALKYCPTETEDEDNDDEEYNIV
ncbi:hypothetical protein ZWY2020_000270 [Hordeum vulgare]|nr:hypothetical protein ZWY2020_000270 [Hordeum vulgare]